jgi:hypothetical protein
MKRFSQLVFLISVIFILLVGMAMTGCATTAPTRPLTSLVEAAGQGNIDAVKTLLGEGG